jgi:hypothetical protein
MDKQMKNIYFYFRRAVLLAVLFIFTGIQAQIRPAEPVIITGSELSELNGVAVTDIHAFSYHNEWSEIPIQIDEKSSSGSYFETDDGIWDSNDELVFQPQDGGNETSPSNWIEDDESKSNPRYRIYVHDPVEDDSTCVYLFQTGKTFKSTTTSYIHYNSEEDDISTETYTLGFDSKTRFWNELKFGQENVDYLDREKIRVVGTALFFFDYELTEDDIIPMGISVKTGKIRIIRRIASKLEAYRVSHTLNQLKCYYRKMVTAPLDTIPIIFAGGVSLIRNSYDFNRNAVGSIIYDKQNMLFINGINETVYTHNNPSSYNNLWINIEFSKNYSILMIGDYSDMSEEIELYFHDNYVGGTADNTIDTGDSLSYGDVGLKFINPPSGDRLTSNRFYFGDNNEESDSSTLLYFNNPLQVSIKTELNNE